MSLLYKLIGIILANLTLSFGITFFASGMNPFDWSNQVFIIGGLQLVIAGSIYVIQGGFFENFTAGYKKLIKPGQVHSSDELFNDDEDQFDKKKLAQILKQVKWVTFISGLVLSLSAFIIYS
ncbi:DUF3899 domain-containing protein [Hazenella coriacea]|uniref:Uncharacterized protein DUF3899 n=1 Tax=Hazenella coriacea TaxID=1179467 RepID=A0A4R3LAM8_9BACL|nr:DUF3899 domain-containing protein [Hazenella coriacea]TCS96913.1 uncharacterized protein DUF3899 [Hazenella coriacea]